jgi:hypothetical protein
MPCRQHWHQVYQALDKEVDHVIVTQFFLTGPTVELLDHAHHVCPYLSGTAYFQLGLGHGRV